MLEECIGFRPVDVETVETNPGLLFGSSVRYVLSHHLCVSDYPIFNFNEEVGITGCHMEAKVHHELGRGRLASRSRTWNLKASMR